MTCSASIYVLLHFRNCFQNYLDYHRCHHKYGEDHAPCEYFQKVFKSICPMAWVSFSLENTCEIKLHTRGFSLFFFVELVI